MVNLMKSLIVLMALVFSQQGFCRLLFDGHIGFGFTLDQNDTQQGPAFEGVEVGARIGPTLGPIILGADVSYSWTNSTYDQISSSSDYKMNKADLGAFLGLEFLKLIRVWGAYYFISEMKFDSPGSYQLRGTAAGGGVGLTVLPYISLNVEAKYYNMNQITDYGKEITVTGEQRQKPLEILISIGCIF
jgi:hypothetical protein